MIKRKLGTRKAYSSNKFSSCRLKANLTASNNRTLHDLSLVLIARVIHFNSEIDNSRVLSTILDIHNCTHGS